MSALFEDKLDEEREFDFFGLNENPFPYSPVPSNEPNIYCDQEDVRKRLFEVLKNTISTGKSNHLIITGKYGNGKSHTLKYANKLLKKQERTVSSYVAQPGEDFVDIYHEIIYDLGYDFFNKLAHEHLLKVIKEDDENEIDINTAEELEKAIKQGDILLTDKISVAIKDLKEETKFIDFARAFIHLVYEETSLYAWQWLSGEGLRYEQRKKMEIHTNIDDGNKAVRALESIKKILKQLNYNSIVIFIDEFESIERLSSKRKQKLLNSLRHFMDTNPKGLSLIIACAPELWSEVMAEYHAFSERIGNQVDLKPLDKKELEKLINKYISTYKGENKKPKNPFTENSLQEILELSHGNIRRAILICGRAFEKANQKNKKKIDTKLINSIT